MTAQTPHTAGDDGELRQDIKREAKEIMPVSTGDELIIRLDDVLALIKAHTAKTAKAYGGCILCFGKGYATVSNRWFGHDTDQDIGSPGGTITGGNDLAMKFCTCNRGKQLEELLAQKRSEL